MAMIFPPSSGMDPESTPGMTAADSFRLESRSAAATAVTQTVVIVNGRPGILSLLETVLDAGHYDVVFVESSEHAYSQVKRVHPHLVILCAGIDDRDGWQVLSMLKLDAETRGIPVLTYTTEADDEVADEPTAEPAETEMVEPSAMERMH